MKLPIVLTFVILVAGSLWGVRENTYLTRMREKHREVTREAAELGISAGSAESAVVTRAGRRPREDAERKGREFAERLVAFAKEMKAREEGGEVPDDAIKKRIELMDDLLSLKGDGLKALIAELRNRSDLDDEMRQGMLSFSIMMLSVQNPEAALALFTESSDMLGDHPMSKHALSSALKQWAKDQPLAALEWIKKNATKHPELVTDDAKQAVIAGAASSDFGLALQLIGELDVSPESVMRRIAQTANTPERQTELLRAIRKAAADAPDKEAGEKLSSNGLRSLLSSVAETGFENATKWMESADLAASEAAMVVRELNYHRTKSDTGRWLDWMAARPVGEDSKNATQNLIRNWTEKDYQAAGTWLADSPAGPLKETATISYLETVAPYDPEVAAQWAATLPDGKRNASMRNIYESLKRKDAAAADAFAERHGVDVKK
jgi:hypothetical protein